MADATVNNVADHGARRHRLFVRAAGWNAVARVVAIMAGLAQVPLALHYLKNEACGLWMALAGTLQLLNFTDLGIGTGLQNKVSEAFGRDDLQEIRELHAAGWRLLGGIGLGFALLALPLCWLLPWENWFKIADPSLRTQLPAALAVLVGGFSLGLPLNAGMRLANGVQQGWMQGVWTAVGSVLGLVFVALGVWLRWPFAVFTGVTAVAPAVANAGITWHIFRHLGEKFSRCVPHSVGVRCPGLVRQGLLFFLPQISGAIMTGAPAIMIAGTLGSAAVLPFSLCQRLSSMMLLFQNMPFVALWPAFAEARSRGDYAWMLKTFKKSMRLALLSGVALGLFFALAAHWIILLWTQNQAAVPTLGTRLGFALWTMLLAWIGGIVYFLNACGRLKGLAVGGITTAGMTLLLIPLATPRWGVDGTVAVIVLAWSALALPITLFDFKKEYERTFRWKTTPGC